MCIAYLENRYHQDALWDVGMPGVAVWCKTTLHPGIHANVTLTHTTYLSIAGNQIHPARQQFCLMSMASSSTMLCPARLLDLFRNGLSNMANSCWHGSQISQISTWRRNNSNPWWCHLQDLKDFQLTSWCQIPLNTFRGLVESMSQWFRVVLPTQY